MKRASLLLCLVATLLLPVLAQEKPASAPNQPRTSAFTQRDWAYTPGSFLSFDSIYTPYDKAIFKAMTQSAIRARSKRVSPTTIEVPSPDDYFDFEFLYDAYCERIKLNQHSSYNATSALKKHISLPKGSKVVYTNGTLSVTAPEEELDTIDKILDCKNYDMATLFKQIKFNDNPPRKDADLYLFVHLCKKNTFMLNSSGGKANKPVKTYTENVSKLIAQAQKDNRIELIITVDPEMEHSYLKETLRILRCKYPVSGTFSRPPENDAEEKKQNSAVPHREEQLKTVPTDLASLVFPHGLEIKAYEMSALTDECDSYSHSQTRANFSRLSKFIKSYLKEIERTHSHPAEADEAQQKGLLKKKKKKASQATSKTKKPGKFQPL